MIWYIIYINIIHIIMHVVCIITFLGCDLVERVPHLKNLDLIRHVTEVPKSKKVISTWIVQFSKSLLTIIQNSNSIIYQLSWFYKIKIVVYIQQFDRFHQVWKFLENSRCFLRVEGRCLEWPIWDLLPKKSKKSL